MLARYGDFHVSVAHDTDAIQTLLSDPNTGQPLGADARGLYWYRDPGIPGVPAFWWALTRYANVIAAWMAGGEQRTDEHWDRMIADSSGCRRHDPERPSVGLAVGLAIDSDRTPRAL